MVLSGLVDPPGSSALPAFDLPPMSSSWTGAPCSPQRTPGFPVELPGVDELHAAFLNESRTRTRRWRPVQEIRDHGPKKSGRSPFPTLLLCGEKIAAKSESPCPWSESIGKIRSRPMYALANMGHPSSTTDRGWGIKSARARRPNLDRFEVQPDTSREEGFVLCSHHRDANELHQGR